MFGTHNFKPQQQQQQQQTNKQRTLQSYELVILFHIGYTGTRQCYS